MPAPSGARVYRDVVLTVDGTDYANQCRKARLVPDQPVVSYRTLVPDGVVQDTDSVVWTLELEGLQINIAGGLAAYFRTNSGNLATIVIQEASGVGKPKATFQATMMMPEFGGEQGAYLTQTLTLPVTGGVTFGTS